MEKFSKKRFPLFFVSLSPRSLAVVPSFSLTLTHTFCVLSLMAAVEGARFGGMESASTKIFAGVNTTHVVRCQLLKVSVVDNVAVVVIVVEFASNREDVEIKTLIAFSQLLS